MRRAKIVCTLGPATTTVDQLAGLLRAGMNVARFNMSHGDHTSHEAVLLNLLTAATQTGLPVSTFLDLQGPKIRLGLIADGPVVLEAGATFTITTDDVPGDAQRCSTSFKGLPTDVSIGDPLLIDDGKIELRATAVTPTDVTCQVVVGGPISSQKGINLPGVTVHIPALTEKDADDLRWGLAQGFDLVALSFVRSADDIAPVHAVMDEVGRRLPVIAKIEKPQAMEHLEDIVDRFDALMVARGDLGVELPYEDVPLAQKRIINAGRTGAKPVIVATQMLESMVSVSRPTRAEASDVANAIMDGADAVMLSDETAVGAYPVEAVQAMDRILRTIEVDGFDEIDRLRWSPHTVPGVVSWGAALIARQVGAKYLVAFSLEGDSARRVCRLRSRIPVLCFTPNQATRQRLGLVWGVSTYSSTTHELRAMITEMDDTLLSQHLAVPGDRVVIVYGDRMGVSGTTNSVKVHEVGQTEGDIDAHRPAR